MGIKCGIVNDYDDQENSFNFTLVKKSVDFTLVKKNRSRYI
jgi:hypothetical protein